jgi:adenylate cyclase
MRGARYNRLRGALFLLVGVGTTALVLLVWAFGVFDEFERNSIDARFSIRGTRQPPAQIVVVAIDDVTTNALENDVWPYPRRFHARVLDRIAADKPRAIAVDIQFTERTTDRDDNALIDAVARAKTVVLATTETLPNGATRIFGGNDVLRDVGASPASALFPTDSAGVIRKVKYSVNGLKTVAVVTVERATGRHVDQQPFRNGGAWIDYAGPAGAFTRYSYSRVLNGQVPASAFTNKIVVIGPSAPSLQDLHQTPVDSLMPGGEVQANAISTVLRDVPLRSSPAMLGIGLIILFSFLTPAISLGNRPRFSMPIAALAAIGFTVAVQLSFNHGRILLFTYPLAALTLSTVGALGVHYVLTAFEREQVRSVFSRFVPESVVKEVLERTDSDLRLGGEEMVGTVMFTDLRGFTSASEHMAATTVIDVINRHLEEITGAVLSHGGTLVSYTGDGVMAVFGAPIEQADHAERAFAAADEMLDVCLPRWNAWLQEHGLHTGFEMGIGLNSGPFMSGNIGSAQRLAYTAMGDTINTCSRLEALTKETPYMAHVAESTHVLLTPEQAAKLTYIDEFPIRGRTTKLKIWGMGLSPVPPKPATAAEGADDATSPAPASG